MRLMGRTHLVAGIACSLACLRPSTPEGCVLAVAGGAVGAVVCDVECHANQKNRDVLLTRFILAVILLLVLAADQFFHLHLSDLLITEHASRAACGLTIIVLTCVRGHFSQHRTFTHSLLFSFLLTLGAWQMTPFLGWSVCLGCLSHLFLDLLNKKPMQLLYPLRRTFCLRLFYADRTANRVLMWAGLFADILLLSWRLSYIWAA